MHVQVYTSSQYPSVFVFFPICTLDHLIKKKTFTEGFSLFIDFGCQSVAWETYTVKEVIRPPLAHPIDIDVFYLFLQKRKITSTTWCLRLKPYHHRVRCTSHNAWDYNHITTLETQIISPSNASHIPPRYNHIPIIRATQSYHYHTGVFFRL